MNNIQNQDIPVFNLWHQPWITVERLAGYYDEISIVSLLNQAECIRRIYDPSPLATAGIQRLLTAIAQFIYQPQKERELALLWKTGKFDAAKITAFGDRYAHRFDLFSEQTPFYQSADLPTQPAKKDAVKTATYLFAELPSGTQITHYRHGNPANAIYCPACLAKGLVMIPAFATSGGAGIKPSINGVPPIYVLPEGINLFESLSVSLMLPGYQPTAASTEDDQPWWERQPLVEHGKEILQVGYIASLTFPARRVRLHPEQCSEPCTRCGKASQWGARTMIFEMGESRSKDSAAWLDPFAAYRLPDEDSMGSKPPTPIRPIEGKSLWREYAGLFLQTDGHAIGKKSIYRPRVIYQFANLNPEQIRLQNFRCVGLRTDMKAKIFEWIDESFNAPPELLADEDAGQRVEAAISFSENCAKTMAGIFRDKFGSKSGKSDRNKVLRDRMLDRYWGCLADPFRNFVLDLVHPDHRETAIQAWADQVNNAALREFRAALAMLSDDAASLVDQVTARMLCQLSVARNRKNFLEEW